MTFPPQSQRTLSRLDSDHESKEKGPRIFRQFLNHAKGLMPRRWRSEVVLFVVLLVVFLTVVGVVLLQGGSRQGVARDGNERESESVPKRGGEKDIGPPQSGEGKEDVPNFDDATERPLPASSLEHGFEDLWPTPGSALHGDGRWHLEGEEGWQRDQRSLVESAGELGLRPLLQTNYSGFGGPWLEDGFFDFWREQSHSEIERLYIPVFWTSITRNPVGEAEREDLKGRLLSFLKAQVDTKRRFFTVVQDAEGLTKLGLRLPPNVLVFNAGGADGYPLQLPVPLSKGDLRPPSQPTKTDQASPSPPRIFLSSSVVKQHFPVRRILFASLDTMDLEEVEERFTGDPQGLQRALGSPKALIHYEGPRWQEVASRSSFCLAPRGHGRTSFRMYEVMQLGCIPVYVWDDREFLPYRDARGFAWHDVGVSVNIGDVTDLPEILSEISEAEIERKRANLSRLRRWFTLPGICEYILKSARGEVVSMV